MTPTPLTPTPFDNEVKLESKDGGSLQHDPNPVSCMRVMMYFVNNVETKEKPCEEEETKEIDNKDNEDTQEKENIDTKEKPDVGEETKGIENMDTKEKPGVEEDVQKYEETHSEKKDEVKEEVKQIQDTDNKEKHGVEEETQKAEETGDIKKTHAEEETEEIAQTDNKETLDGKEESKVVDNGIENNDAKIKPEFQEETLKEDNTNIEEKYELNEDILDKEDEDTKENPEFKEETTETDDTSTREKHDFSEESRDMKDTDTKEKPEFKVETQANEDTNIIEKPDGLKQESYQADGELVEKSVEEQCPIVVDTTMSWNVEPGHEKVNERNEATTDNNVSLHNNVISSPVQSVKDNNTSDVNVPDAEKQSGKMDNNNISDIANKQAVCGDSENGKESHNALEIDHGHLSVEDTQLGNKDDRTDITTGLPHEDATSHDISSNKLDISDETTADKPQPDKKEITSSNDTKTKIENSVDVDSKLEAQTADKVATVGQGYGQTTPQFSEEQKHDSKSNDDHAGNLMHVDENNTQSTNDNSDVVDCKEDSQKVKGDVKSLKEKEVCDEGGKQNMKKGKVKGKKTSKDEEEQKKRFHQQRKHGTKVVIMCETRKLRRGTLSLV